ncbi:aspartic proteinase 36 [Aristolochia californica]|uniref:aspartic proteinase 36 n=1 Tax=Aristolochia californica TaxID=171875 RepID=UPI0035E2EF08
MDRKAILLLCVYLLLLSGSYVSSTGVFRVQRKFAGKGKSMTDLKSHDSRRHGRMLGAVDLPLGGIGLPSEAGLYFAEIGLGTPSKKYYVQVDTGSDILWVNCIQCKRCPKKSDLGVELTLYDPNDSKSGKLVTCDQPFCSSQYDNLPNCTPDVLCQYSVQYGDGSSTAGYYVKDVLHYNQASGNLQTREANASIIFGCGAQQSGDLGTSGEAVDGILGFGQSNSSMISQLASVGKVKKVFAHCLDSVNGGGIFAIGNIVRPKVKTTPMVPNQQHYNVNMKAIEVGGTVLRFPTDVFDTGDWSGTIIDSGTTLAYLPETVFTPLINAIMSYQPAINVHTVQEFQCFKFTGSVDDGFPSITLHFDGDLSLTVYPREYFFQIGDDAWCIGWQNSGMQSKDGKDVTLLGDLVLSNKLVVYDLENQTIGWTEYNCSSSIQVQDDKSSSVYNIGAHDISNASSLQIWSFHVLLFLVVALLNLIH